MKAYCINLDHRTDKWTKFIMQGFPFEVIRFSAIRKDNPSEGCLLSHLELLKKCETEILIFEDDCQMLQPWSLFDAAYSQLPEDWDILYLGANLHKKLTRYSKNLFHLQSGWATHGMLISKSGADKILSYPVKEILKHKNYDTFLSRKVQSAKCFIIYPFFATQFPGHSDVVNSWRGCDDFIPNFKKHTDESVLH